MYQLLNGWLMKAADFREWRQRAGLTQADAAAKLGVSRGTIQNWESEATAIPAVVETGCQIWGDRLRQIRPDLGPVTLIYSDGPMFINPYAPHRLAMMKQEPYLTNAAALARVRELWGREDFHNPFIMEESGKHLWNAVELARVVAGTDSDAPLWRKVIINKENHDETAADTDCRHLMTVVARAYVNKNLPKDVIIFRDRSEPALSNYVFYFSPSAFALTPEIREIANLIQICDEPKDMENLRKLNL
jgi:transcriptional regulator with XRE-family HTH domain